MTCHPTHFESGPLPSVSEEQVAKNWEEFRKEDRVDPRSIRRQHKFKPGHEPDYAEPDSGWKYVDVQFDGEEADPDQRDMLRGGPAIEMDCERCGHELHVVGSMSTWDVMNQPGVSLANRDSISDSRKKELQEEKVVILACPTCKLKWQWLEELLPKGKYNV